MPNIPTPKFLDNLPKPGFANNIPMPEFVNNIPTPEIARGNFTIGPTVEQLRAKADGTVPYRGLGIRGLFRVAILIVVVLAFLTLLSISFKHRDDAP